MNRFLLLPLLVLPVGCAGVDDPEATPSAYAVNLPAEDAARILDLVNYPGTTRAVLDDGVALDTRAAANIAAFRAGLDGVLPSADDQYFADLAALDAVPYVGDTAFAKLQAYALAHPAPAGEVVEGVAFRGWEAQTVVWAVDHVELSVLDGILDARAAQGLFAARPFASVTQMGPVAYVGPTALEKLRAAATPWWAAMTGGAPALAGTFDGVAFDEATAKVALEIANQATAIQLVAHGMTSTSGHIVGNRPYTNLAQVAAVAGVGPGTMTSLRSYAQSTDWPPPPPGTCIPAFEDAVGPHLPDLLLMSESDRPLDLVSFAGAGKSAPTGAMVLALVSPPQGSTAEVRPVENFFITLEQANDQADPNAAAAVQAAFGKLTDVIYVAIHNPHDVAVVHVYLLGRTACGDVVGVHSIAIET